MLHLFQCFKPGGCFYPHILHDQIYFILKNKKAKSELVLKCKCPKRVNQFNMSNTQKEHFVSD